MQENNQTDYQHLAEFVVIGFLTLLCCMLSNLIMPYLKNPEKYDYDIPKQVWTVYLANYEYNTTSNESNGWFEPKCNCAQDKNNTKMLSNYKPLTLYSSYDKDILIKHVNMIENAAIDALIIPWNFQIRSNETIIIKKSVDTLFDVVKGHNLTICAMIQAPQDAKIDFIKTEIDNYIKLYGDHPNVLKINGRLVVIIYDSHEIRPKEKLHELIESYRSGPLNTMFLSTMITKPEFKHQHEVGFEGFLPYFVPNGPTYGSFANDRTELAIYQKNRDIFIIPTVSPGFNITSQNSYNSHTNKQRNGGDHYRKTWEEAEKLNPHIVLLQSFNYWQEGTNIEPAEKFEQDNDSFLYLNLTRELVTKFKSTKN